MNKKELLEKLIEITNEGFTSVNLLPKTIKEYNEEAYCCILETLEEKVRKSYIDTEDIVDFINNNMFLKVEFISSQNNAGIKEISLVRSGEQILILQGIMNINIDTLIDKTGKELAEKILNKLQKVKKQVV